MPTPQADDIDALTEATLDGYEAILSPAALKQLRGMLALSLEAHPVMSEIVASNAPRQAVDDSKPIEREDAPESELERLREREAAKKGGTGGR